MTEALLSKNITVDDDAGVLTAFGVRIHADLLRNLGTPTREGTWIRVCTVEGGISTIQQRTDLIPRAAPGTGRREEIAALLAEQIRNAKDHGYAAPRVYVLCDVVDEVMEFLRKPFSAMPLVKKLMEQRDGAADVLRRVMAKLRSESGSTDPMEAFAYDASWESLAKEADASLAECPSYEQQLRNICEGAGLDYDQVMANAAKAKVTNIKINGKPHTTTKDSLSYEDVMTLAGFDPARIFSMTYCTRRKGDEQRSGILSPRRSVKIEEGMLFDAGDTSNA